MAQASSNAAGSSAIQVIVYWAIVAVPLSWGVYKTVQKSIPLFSGASPAPATVAPAVAPTVVPPPAAAITPLPEASPSPTATAGAVLMPGT